MSSTTPSPTPSASHGFMSLRLTTTTTKPAENEVSWQSAMWPIIACMFTVMTQNSGRVLGASPYYSPALRASPLVCLLDVLMTIIEFTCLLIARCPVSKAARHVWYNRYAQSSCKIERSRTGDGKEDLHAGTRENHPDRDEVNKSVMHDRAGEDTNFPLAGPSSTPSRLDVPLIRPFEEHGICNNLHHEYDGMSSTCTTCIRNSNVKQPTPPPSPCLHSSSNDIQYGGGTSNTLEEAMKYTWIHKTFFPGSEIDRSWRLSICAFVLGALPQIIKISSMHGVPWTQAYVSAYAISFIIPECLRLVAGKAGAVELPPSPLSARVEYYLMATKTLGCAMTIGISGMYYYWFTNQALAFAFQGYLHQPMIISLSVAVGFSGARLLSWVWKRLDMHWEIHLPASLLQRLDTFLQPPKNVFTNILQVFDNIFALNTSTISLILPVNHTLFISLTALSIYTLYTLLTDTSIETLIIIVIKVGLLAYYFVGSAFLFAISFLLYRALFVGVWSRVPRRLTGIEGSMAEFMCGYFVLLAICGTFAGYAFNGWEGGGTYKPSWAENLG